jgi:hypothetical protein
MGLRDLGALAAAMRRRTSETGRRGGAFDALVEEGEDALEHLRAIAAHVRAFRDGRISLEDLLAGPGTGEEDALLEMAVLLEEAARELDRRPPRPRPRRGGTVDAGR